MLNQNERSDFRSHSSEFSELGDPRMFSTQYYGIEFHDSYLIHNITQKFKELRNERQNGDKTPKWDLAWKKLTLKYMKILCQKGVKI